MHETLFPVNDFFFQILQKHSLPENDYKLEKNSGLNIVNICLMINNIT